MAQKAGSSASVLIVLSPTSQMGDDWGEGLHVRFEDDVVGEAPAFPVRLEILDYLVYRPDEDVGALEDLRRTQLWPPPREFLGCVAAMICHEDPLHQRVQFEAVVTGTSGLTDELHPLFDARYLPPGKVRRCAATPYGEARKTDNVGCLRREREELSTIAPDEQRRMGALDGQWVE